MTATAHPPPQPATCSNEKAMALALGLAHAENRLRAFTSDQVDAILDADGNTHLLRPAQEHFRATERHLQAMLESVADAIMVVNRAGVILLQSRAASLMLGYEPGQLPPRDFFALVHVDDLPTVHLLYLQVIEGFFEYATAPIRFRSRHGACVPVEAIATPVRDSSPKCVIFRLRPLAATASGLPSLTP
jgi:PAS domain S-box-containing protein